MPPSPLKGLFCAYFRDVWFCQVAAINDHIIVQSIGFSLEAYTTGRLPPRNFLSEMWLLEKIYEDFWYMEYRNTYVLTINIILTIINVGCKNDPSDMISSEFNRSLAL